MKNVIFYFSGTGNSLRTARIIARQIGGATLVAVKKDSFSNLAETADSVGFICPVYEWDVPEPMIRFAEQLTINCRSYIYMVATYSIIHGRCFETMNTVLKEKGLRLHYGKALRCVASQCVAYEPFPDPRRMVPHSERSARKIAMEIAAKRQHPYPRMSAITRRLYKRMMQPFLDVRHEYDKGFYTSDQCIGCGLCQRICPVRNITIADKHPVWNHDCNGCNACVVYCPKKAILFKTPKAYEELDNAVTRRLGLPENRTRYHNPYITARDLVADGEEIISLSVNDTDD